MDTKDFNSTLNQTIKEKFLKREVLGCISTLMQRIVSDEHGKIYGELKNLDRYNVNIPDLENLKEDEKIGSCKGFILNKEEIVGKIKRQIAILKGEESFSELMLADEEISEVTDKRSHQQIDERIEELKKYIADIEKAKGEPRKIYEWWHVTNWLYDKLEEKGDPVWSDGHVFVWGRTRKGQEMVHDDVISEICSDLEILEGQKKEWKA